MKYITVLIIILFLVAHVASAQEREPDGVMPLGICTAFVDIHSDTRILQINQRTGDGYYDVPMLVRDGQRVRVSPKYGADSLVLLWYSGAEATLKVFTCPGDPWYVYAPVV